jgi:signal peptidase II
VLLAIAAAVVLADQTAKFFAVERLTSVFDARGLRTAGERLRGFYTIADLEPYRRAPVPVLDGYWHMKYVENPGAAWGIFQGMSERFRHVFFTVVSIAAIAFILGYFRRLAPDQRHLGVALALVLGGAVGNFVDRLARRYVIDFIDWHWRDGPAMHWPTFNLADAAICVGVALLFVGPTTPRRKAAPLSAGPEAQGAEPAGKKGIAPGL